MRFIVETYRIAWRIWGEGSSQNPVWTGGNSPLIFQHPDREANVSMAREVVRRWGLGEGRTRLTPEEERGRYRKGKRDNQVSTCLRAMEEARQKMLLDTAACRIYTTGYTGKKPGDLLALARDNNAVIVDIRKSASSRVPCWRGPELASLLGERYVHAPQLGNNNYKAGGDIQIADIEGGVRAVLAIEKPAVILLCACERADICHRSVVAEALRERGQAVRELASWTRDQGGLPF